jgi:putative photosynthetic complex assembly protein 2
MEIALPILAGFVAWWLGTGVLFYLARRANRSDPSPLLAGISVVALVAGVLVVFLRPIDTPAAAALGFGMAVLLWGWHEFAFLSGVMTGSERRPCPRDLKGWARFRYGFHSLSHHEYALAATVLVLWLSTLGAANQAAFLAFAVLWGMRISAKLNLFFGVPIPNAHLFPPRLRHLTALVPSRSPGLFYGLSVAFIVAVTLALFQAGATSPTLGARTGYFLAGTLAALAVLEHLAMVLPLRIEGLWGLEEEDDSRSTSP